MHASPQPFSVRRGRHDGARQLAALLVGSPGLPGGCIFGRRRRAGSSGASGPAPGRLLRRHGGPATQRDPLPAEPGGRAAGAGQPLRRLRTPRKLPESAPLAAPRSLAIRRAAGRAGTPGTSTPGVPALPGPGPGARQRNRAATHPVPSALDAVGGSRGRRVLPPPAPRPGAVLAGPATAGIG